jgi:hypothetical protein
LKIGRNVARAVDALRRGWPVMIDGISFLAVETADEAGLLEFDSAGPADLLISGNRAVTLKLANQRDGVPTGPVRLARTSWIDLAEATAIADPAQDLRTPLKGPFRTLPLPPMNKVGSNPASQAADPRRCKSRDRRLPLRSRRGRACRVADRRAFGRAAPGSAPQ